MTHASVFSGIGGPEVAAAMLGWENLFHCEINPFGRTVLQYWFPNAKSYEDITKTDFSEFGGRVNVLTGGFPCQPFSYAGQRRGADDDRYLWPFMHRCINQVRPDWVVCENVAGILTMVEQGDVTKVAAEKSLFDEGDTLYRYRLEATFTLERICQDLERDGYAVQAVVIPACAVGAPHRRDRVFIIGHRIVADTDNYSNGRASRTSSRSEGEEGLQERHEVRQPDQPTQVRPTAEVYVPDPIRTGLERQDQPRCGEGGQRVHLRRDPARCNRQDGGARVVAHPKKQCGQRNGFEQPSTGRAQQEQFGGRSCKDCGIAGCGRWKWSESGKWLPTVSPVHRGNDGIPFPLDDLTISPSKWRTESLKAYGNAIVPQVMYEIFKAIEETYK